MIIETQTIKPKDFPLLIEFDRIHLIEVMSELGIEASRCPPVLTNDELLSAYNKQDILLWLLVNKEIVGYLWREKRPNCLFGMGAAIKKEFYGLGLSEYFIKLTEQIAKEHALQYCQLAVIPQNGRVISTYMKHGYKIVKTVPAYLGAEYPDTFRCIMEKNLSETTSNLKTVNRCTVSALDDEQLTQLTNNGYVGTCFIKGTNQIVFELMFQ
ncbi:hypothetical protein BN59_01533 [Legionella massiliensis]|uniref:N-acetyltransferase domain-containing protein n=1 Tax=Legionella massiliensis TaxID=1034943 RepID=A0A078KW78_9GAMM|nr:GNAT family N-acetyltransferase [Legionella massiliensis]CDZ77251.1 hypothetical protein BN59_01533 [Legionella massiliensis]CEE12989.1 hypothetical protein BN1094_01533 [Legionella massiliensis]